MGSNLANRAPYFERSLRCDLIEQLARAVPQEKMFGVEYQTALHTSVIDAPASTEKHSMNTTVPIARKGRRKPVHISEQLGFVVWDQHRSASGGSVLPGHPASSALTYVEFGHEMSCRPPASGRA